MPCTLDIDIHLIGGDDVDTIVSTDLRDTQLTVDSVEQVLTLGIIDAPTGGDDDVNTNIIVSPDLCDTQLIVDSVEQLLTLEIIDAPTGGGDTNITVSMDLCDTQLIVDSVEQLLTLEIIDAPTCGGGDVSISKVADNRLERKPDGLYVRDRLDPDPVAYYLLSRG